MAKNNSNKQLMTIALIGVAVAGAYGAATFFNRKPETPAAPGGGFTPSGAGAGNNNWMSQSRDGGITLPGTPAAGSNVPPRILEIAQKIKSGKYTMDEFREFNAWLMPLIEEYKRTKKDSTRNTINAVMNVVGTVANVASSFTQGSGVNGVRRRPELDKSSPEFFGAIKKQNYSENIDLGEYLTRSAMNHIPGTTGVNEGIWKDDRVYFIDLTRGGNVRSFRVLHAARSAASVLFQKQADGNILVYRKN